MKLDQRLSAVAALVRLGSRLADIGTDHAYLPVWLVQNGVCPAAIAADLRPGPLEAARRHVAAAGLEDRISLRLGDGLAPVFPGEADDIVIAGMGGETIAAILAAADWLADARLRLVLQPMSRAEETRRWLLKNGFSGMDTAQNLLIIHTVSGMAMAVAAALEELGIRDIIGCIAGDNTIMCATKSPENAEQVKIQLEKMLNGR